MALSPEVEASLLARESLPAKYSEQIRGVWGPLAERLLTGRIRSGRTIVLGLCGPQGSGKSSGAQALLSLLHAAGVSAAALSLDDVYLGRRERAQRADEVHPLFAARGPPGTHDVTLGARVLDGLAGRGRVYLPRFDKASDDRVDPADWPAVRAPVDVVIFEGWCVGAHPEPDVALEAPVNALEALEDPDGRWRRSVNAALAGDYQALFGRIDVLALLRPPAFSAVWGWRLEQEHKLRARTGGGMTDPEVHRFIQHYERLSRWIDLEMPARADLVVQLDEARKPLSVRFA